MGGRVSNFALLVAFSLMGFAGITLMLTAAEMAFPQGPQMSVRKRFQAFGLGCTFILATVAVSAVVAQATHALGFRPLLTGSGWWVAIVGLLVFEFGYYWFHRMQHAVPFLWRIHSVHHAQALGAGSGYHHLLEAPLKAALVGAPAGLLFKGEGSAIFGAVVGSLWAVQGNYLHSTTRLNFGRLAWIFCDNRLHRIHHSTNPEHFDRNFGVVTPLYDWLFGTLRMPQGEWPKVGLDGFRDPKLIDLVGLKRLADFRPEEGSQVGNLSAG
jgi:sterol desaturase/sphingolipid hydroxylase (fatty acid hydroxylase superfamily)